MKNVQLLVACIVGVLLTACVLHAQTPTGDSLDYYPYRVGDAWRLREGGSSPLPPYTTTVLRDSVDESGNIDLFFDQDGVINIDTSGDVYDVSTERHLLLYRLRAKVGDRWRRGDDSALNGLVYITCTGIYSTTWFGQPVVVKEFQRWLDYSPIGGNDSVWRATYRLARGFGLIDELHEPSAYFYLSGVRIGGRSYGEPIAGVLDNATPRVPLHVTPNPFTEGATIAYHLTSREHVRITISDPLGRVVDVPVDNVLDAGDHTATIDGSTLPAGAYFYQLCTPSRTFSGSLIRR